MTAMTHRGLRCNRYLAHRLLDRQEVRRRLPVPVPSPSRAECAAWAVAMGALSLGSLAYLVGWL